MSRLSDALKSSQKQQPSGLMGEIEGALKSYFRKDIQALVNQHVAELSSGLTASSERERERVRELARESMDTIADQVMERVGQLIATEVAKRPLDIQQPITQVIEKPIERIVEKPNPLTAMKVKRVDGRITELNTNKGKFKVSRDEDGLITGVTKA